MRLTAGAAGGVVRVVSCARTAGAASSSASRAPQNREWSIVEENPSQFLGCAQRTVNRDCSMMHPCPA